MNYKPLVSVVVPTHNVEKYIKDCLLSVINQTYHELDIVIVDDFSSDNTVEIIKSLNDSRIRIFRNNKNKGAAFSRNLGIEKSNGEYISFLDGDDIWDLNKIEKQIKFMLDNNILFCSCFYDFINDNNIKNGKYMSAPKKITHKQFLKTDYIGCITVIYKKSIYPNLMIPETILKRNDYALWIKLSEKADCYVLPDILASHRTREGSLSSGSKIHLFKFHKLLFQSLYDFNEFKSCFFAFRNVYYYFFRRLFYYKKIRQRS